MKLNISLSLMAIAVMMSMLFVLRSSIHGVYFTQFDLIWCTSPASCTHELAHFADKQAGWVSRSNDYRIAVQLFIMTDPGNPWALVASQFPVTDRSYQELYACMWEAARGNIIFIPERLRPFYDVALLEGLQRVYGGTQ